MSKKTEPQEPLPTDWLTIPEAAAIGGMDPETLRRHIRAGSGPKCMRWGVIRKHRRVRREDLMKWLGQEK